MGKALKLTVCSEPLVSSRPQWNLISASSNSCPTGRGPPDITAMHIKHNQDWYEVVAQDFENAFFRNLKGDKIILETTFLNVDFIYKVLSYLIYLINFFLPKQQ